jgi:hypothetical protein
MKLFTIYYKLQAKHDEGKCQYDTQDKVIIIFWA